MRSGLAVLVRLGHLRHVLEPPSLSADDVDSEEAEGAIESALIKVQLIGIFACAVAGEQFAELAQDILPNRGGFRKLPVRHLRSEEHTSELQSLMRISYAVLCLKTNNHNSTPTEKRHEYTTTSRRRSTR